ncbi:hypothetical protein ACJX0J_016055, partial [Zea mays]
FQVLAHGFAEGLIKVNLLLLFHYCVSFATIASTSLGGSEQIEAISLGLHITSLNHKMKFEDDINTIGLLSLLTMHAKVKMGAPDGQTIKYRVC